MKAKLFAVIEPHYGIFQYIESGLTFDDAAEVASKRIAETHGGDVYVTTVEEAERVVGTDDHAFTWYGVDGKQHMNH